MRNPGNNLAASASEQEQIKDKVSYKKREKLHEPEMFI